MLLPILIGGVAAAGLVGGFLLGRKHPSFTLEDCLEQYKKMGYTNEQAYRICLEKARASSSGDVLGSILPLAALGVVGILAFRFMRDSEQGSFRTILLTPKIVSSGQSVNSKEQEIKNASGGAVPKQGMHEGLPFTPHPIR
jgi:hypothetical protein